MQSSPAVVANHNVDVVQEPETGEKDPESITLHQPLLKKNSATSLSSVPLAMLGAKVSHIESLDYE